MLNGARFAAPIVSNSLQAKDTGQRQSINECLGGDVVAKTPLHRISVLSCKNEPGEGRTP